MFPKLTFEAVYCHCRGKGQVQVELSTGPRSVLRSAACNVNETKTRFVRKKAQQIKLYFWFLGGMHPKASTLAIQASVVLVLEPKTPGYSQRSVVENPSNPQTSPLLLMSWCQDLRIFLTDNFRLSARLDRS